jgi:hypothetical protein
MNTNIQKKSFFTHSVSRPFFINRRNIMLTKSFSRWLRLSVIMLLLLPTFAAPPAHADAPIPDGILSAGYDHSCAIRPDGSVDCWGFNHLGQSEDQPSSFVQVGAGMYYTCALTTSGAIDCWGDNLYGNIQDLPGPYTQLSADENHLCALTPAGAVECWGLNTYGQSEDQPGPYALVSAGLWHNCALAP